MHCFGLLHVGFKDDFVCDAINASFQISTRRMWIWQRCSTICARLKKTSASSILVSPSQVLRQWWSFNCLIFFSFAYFPHCYVIMWDCPTDRFNDFNLFKIFDPGPIVTAIIKHFIHQVALARRQRRESSCHLPTCLPHTVEASHCPFNCWTSSRKAANTNF